ncbi:MAG: ATP-binding cassette domain-containing protein [Burkholderiales bacterium]|nr:ATP-binding cassette domain-containing protein [Burkholderiales bacterium]
MTERLLTLHGASVRYGPVEALAAVDLSLHRGERLALVGANGSGKTTLLRLLDGMPASGGERRVHRAVPSAMLFQRPFLLRLSVRANVMLSLALRRVARGERRARCDEALRRVGLLALADRLAPALSGGQQQRLALARAWALRPELLLLDEPTASLDPGAKREIESLIEEVAADGVTIVMSTHNLGQAKRLATRVVYLEAGKLVVDLPVDRFFNDALPSEAAQFLQGELPWP